MNDTARILIVEDNGSFALEMEMNVAEMGYEVIGIWSKGEEALRDIPGLKPDLVIMDINLEGEMDGLELAHRLEHTAIPILFITVHDEPEYFENARKSNWAGYLVKPFDRISLQAALEVALRQRNGDAKQLENALGENILRSDSLLIKAQSVYHNVRFTDMDFIQSEGNYCTVFAKDRKYALKISLRQLLECLPRSLFVQIHKSYAVQLSRLDLIDTNTNEVCIGSHRLPLGKGFRDALISRFRVLK